MASISVSGDTSGAVTIAAPAVASTPTLTLPTVSGTFITTGSSGQSIPKAALPTGSVLQVVTNTYTGGQVSTTNTTMTSTTFATSITPTSSTSKILVLYSGSIYLNGSTGNQAYQTLYRGSTDLGTTNGMVEITGGGFWYPSCISYLDSPSTTSSTTYTIYHKRLSGTSVVFGGDKIGRAHV